MALEKTVLREDVKDRSDEILHDVWISSDRHTPDLNVAETLDDSVWIAGKKGDFRDIVIESINESEDFICFSTFLFGDSLIEKALLDASERGVRVYMLCPSEKIDKEYEDEEDVDERSEEHKEFLDRVGGRILIRSAEHLHSKFILIDPKTPAKRIGFLSTANFNRALNDNPEIMVKLEGDEVEDLFMQFIHGFWEQAQSEHKKTEDGKGGFPAVSNPPSDLATGMSLCDLPVTVKSARSDYENLTLQEEVMKFINSSEGPLTISTYGIDIDHDVARALISKAKSVDITILVPLRSVNSEAYANLSRAGIRVLGMDRLHAKVILGMRDSEKSGLLMTANLQPKGLDTGYETGVNLSDDRLEKVVQVIESWKQSAPWIYKDSIEMGDVTNQILVRREIDTARGKTQRYVEEKIVDSIDEELPDVKQTSIEIEPEPQRKNSSTLSRKLRYKWKLVRPVLPKDAKKHEEENEESLPLFKKGNQVFILVSEEKDIPQAVELKQSKYKGARIVIQ
jgi:cardiolipin synthase